MLFILNRQEKVVGVLKNSGKNSVPFFNDLLTEDLATGSETFEFTTVSNYANRRRPPRRTLYHCVCRMCRFAIN